MRIVLYTNDNLKNNGSFAALFPTGELSLEATIAKDVPAGSTYKIVNLENLSERVEFEKVMTLSPLNINYWMAWEGNFDDTDSPIAFSINLEKAKTCHLEYVRQKRDEELSKLDIEYQKADEANNSELKVYIATKKQKLRDLPSDTRIVNCTDFETLKTLTYETLRDS